MKETIHLKQGELHFSTNEVIVETTVGSCIAYIVWDRLKKTGGMAHYFLAYNPSKGESELDPQFGDSAIKSLLRVFKKNGSNPKDLQIKLVGGANVTNDLSKINAGDDNCRVAQQLTREYGLNIVSQSIGGLIGKKVKFNTYSGKVQISRLSARDINKQNVRSILPAGYIPDHIIQRSIVAIGASTGGPEAIHEIISMLPETIPPIVIALHIPEAFSGLLAQRLNNEFSHVKVVEAETGLVPKPGTIYLAPGGKHMKLQEFGETVRILITDEPPVNKFKPSVDYLFNSMMKIRSHSIVAVLLTGMGDDGARGLLNLRQKGWLTIAQNEYTSVVFGMPKVAIQLNAAKKIESLSRIAIAIVDSLPVSYRNLMRNQ